MPDALDTGSGPLRSTSEFSPKIDRGVRATKLRTHATNEKRQPKLALSEIPIA
jgi:hypothetical protein